MSNFLFRNLDKLTVSKGAGDTRTLSMDRPTSATGKVMQRCPTSGCQPAVFQLGLAPEEREITEEYLATIRRAPGTNGVTCPYCGTDGDDQDYVSPEDIEHAKNLAIHAVEQDISNMLGGMAKSFNHSNRSGRNDMFSISMEHKPSRKPRPTAYREDLLRSISCHVCSREYGVYALALFCPDCGSPNVSTHFDREIEIINQQIEISKLIDDENNKEVSYRLLANAHEDALTALETTLKAIYSYIVITSFPDKQAGLDKIGNTFQNLGKAEKKFKKLNIDLLATLSEEDKDNMLKAIQKRHVIGHNLGLADEKYTHLADDAQIGQNVPVLAHEIEEFTKLCNKLIHAVEGELTYVVK